MFSGTQFSLYPMTADFVPAILRGIAALDSYAGRIRRETDDLSTLLVGPPDLVVQAMRDAFVATARNGGHVVLAGTLSRGCPALARFAPGPQAGLAVAAQISLYPLGTEAHMARIGACIDFLKAARVFDRSKNFCTKLRGDAADVFAAIERCYLDFAPASAHVVLTVTVSAGSPTKG
jgi:uncharacterized protein YqgV (UPF0045/DUF77 family)